MSSGGGVMSENISTIITGMNLHVGGGGGDIKPFSTVDEDYAEIRPFFTNDEWSQMSTVLKQRCRQLKQNYELLKMFCVEPEIPDFMAKKAIYGCNNDEVELLPDPVVAAEPRMVTRSALKQGKPFQEPSESRGRQPKRRRQTKETSTKRKRVVVESSDDETDIAVESCSLEFECFKTLDELVDHVSHSIGDDISNSFPSHPLGGATSDSSKQKRKQLHERYLKLKAGVLTRCCDYETGVVNNSGNFSGENTDLGNSPDDGGAFNCQFCAAIFKHYLQLQRHEAVVHRFVDRGTQKLKRKGAAESPGGRRRKKGRTIPSSTKNLRNYQCSICGAAFKRNAHLKRHQTNVHRTSSAQQPTNVSPSNKNRKKPAFYSCDSCNTNFVTEAQLITHQRRRSRCIAGNDFLAKFDDENNFNSQRWRRKTHFRGRFWPLGRRFVCRYCCKLFRNASIQLIHELIHQNRRPYRCDTCGVVFKLQVCLDEHYRRQHLAEQYKCPYCSLALSKLADCRRHVLSCSLRDKCATKNCCETCNKSFKDYYALRRHRECHNDLRPYVCDKCGKRFKSTKNLRGHIAQVHTAQYPFECPVCKKPYKSQSSMRLHKKTHSGNPPLQCPVCSRRFFVRAILERHMVAHTGEKPFLCKVCGAQFARVSHMKRHEYEVHGCDGEWMNGKIPKFECGKCGIVFKRKGHLARHEKAFHGNINVLQPPPSSDGHSWVENDHRCSVSAPVAPKSFVCQICGSVFARQGRLTRHTANVHGLNKRAQLTGNETQMQFDCKQCGRLFKCKEYLTRHEVYVHSGPGTTAADGGAGGGGPAVIAEPQFYICQACGKSFKSSAYLRKHEKAVHGIAGKPQPFACETCGACFKRRDYMKRHEVHAHGASATISGSQHQPSSIQQQSLEPLQQQLHHAKQQSLYTDQHIQEFYFLSPRSAMTMPSTSTCLKVDEVNPSNVSNPVVLVPASSSTVLDFNKSIRPQQNPLTSNSSGKEFSSGTDIITPVACQFCDKVFSGEKYLQMHEASFHGTSAAGEFSSFRCQLCNKGFRRSRHLNRHFKTVHDLSPSQQRSNADQQPSTTQVMTLVDGHLEPQMVTVPSVQQQHRPRRPAASGPRKPRAPKLNPVTVVPAQIQVQQAATPSQQQQQIIPQNIVATIVQDGTTLQIIAPAQVQIAQPSQQIYIERHNIVGGALCFEQLPYSATAATANQISRVASFQLSGQAQSQQPAVTTVQNNNSVQNDLSGILAEFFSNPQLPPSNYYTLLYSLRNKVLLISVTCCDVMTGISEVIANMNLPALVKQEPMETDDFADVHQFFSDEEWSMMNDVWKQRCRQLKQNYDMLRMFGVEPDLPDFMAGKDYTYTGPVNNLAAVVASSAISKVQLQSSASATELAAPPPSTTPKLEPRMLKRKPPPPKTGGRKFSRFHKRRRVKIEEESDDDQEEIKIDRTETDCILLLEDVLQTVTEAIEHEELFDPDIDEDLTVEEQEEKLLANYFFRIHNRTMIIIDKRPFHCQFCDKTYARRPDLARHEKSAHRESVLLPPVRQPKLEIKEEPPSMEPEEEGVSYRLRKRKVYFTPEMGGGIPLSGMTPAIPEQVAVSEPVVVREPKFKNKEILGKYTKRLKGRKRNFLLGRHLQCVACSKLFNSLRAFRLHQGIHTATPSRCKQCFATFKLRKCLSSHYKRFHTVHAYKCFFCPTMMGRMRELRGHMSVCPNKDKKRHTCGICGKGFRDSMEHKRHAATHYNPGKPHQCDQCGRGFRTTKNLRRHVFKSHKDGNQYHCSKCSKSFPSKEDLGQHRLSVHGVAIMITCEICTKVCYGKSALERHMLAAHGNRPFKCKICTKPFARIAHLERHEKEVHGGLGDFVCNVCGTPFKRKDRLIRHQQTVHTEGNNGSMRRRRPPRPRAPYDPTNSGGSGSGGATREVGQTSFLCQICGAVFSKQHRLHRHTENVHGVYRDYDSQVTPVVAPPPSFDCKLCGRVFKCREYLSRHETYVHGNEGGDTTAGGFLCFSCGKSFKCKMYLHKHERSVHGIEADSSSTLQPQFACNDCGALFKRREYLRRHESHVHKKESVDLLETPAGSFTTPAGEQSAINVCNCQFCGKAFADESYLRRHEAEFHGTSASGSEFSFSFTCDLCGRGFKRGQLLNRHYKTQHGQDRGGGVTARTPRSSTGGGGGNGSGGTPSSRKPKKPKTEPKCSQDAAIAAVVMNGLSTAFEQRTSNVAGGGANNNVGSAVVVQVTEHQPQQQQPHPQQPQQQIAFERHPMVANALAFDHMAPYAPNQLQAINFQMNQMNNHHHHHPGINAAVTHAHTGPSTHAHTHQAAMGQQLNTHTLNSQLNQLSQQNNDLSGLLAEFFSNPHSSQLTSGPYYTLL